MAKVSQYIEGVFGGRPYRKRRDGPFASYPPAEYEFIDPPPSLSDPRAARIGKRALQIYASSNDDAYFQHVGDGIEDAFDHFCARHIAPDSQWALDIGANIGVTAAILAQHLPNGQVLAFEPGASVFGALRKNVTANGLENVIPIQAAVSDRPGVLTFAENSAYGHISDTGASVRSTTIDEIVSQNGIDHLDFIKIDVEGFEPAVLRGATDTLRMHRPLVYMEFNSWCLTTYSRENPLTFLEWIFANFAHVYAVEIGAEAKLRRLFAADAFHFLHDNFAHGFLDDLVMTNAEDRIVPMPAF